MATGCSGGHPPAASARGQRSPALTLRVGGPRYTQVPRALALRPSQKGHFVLELRPRPTTIAETKPSETSRPGPASRQGHSPSDFPHQALSGVGRVPPPPSLPV